MDALESNLSSQIFRTIIALDHTDNRYSICHDEWPFLGFGVKGAEALLQATVTATLSFLAFTFASLLVAIQVASGQLTPRIIATILLSNNIVRYTVGLFIFTLLFAIGAQNRLEATVYQLPLFVAAVLASLCFDRFFVPDRLRFAIVAANFDLDASRE